MTNEEKLQRLLEMQDHPERYTEEEIRQQMADEECRQLYEQMVRGADAVFAEAEVADATNGSSDHPVLRTTFLLRRGKKYLVAANIIGVLMLSHYWCADAFGYCIRGHSYHKQCRREYEIPDSRGACFNSAATEAEPSHRGNHRQHPTDSHLRECSA